MPKTEGFRILDAITEDKAKNTAGMHNQNVARRKLADISNQPQNRKLLIQEKPQCIETAAKEYINQLQKENMAMVKMLAQRNKIIEHNGIELDRVRVNLLKMQEQNQQLATSNSQMLVELNSGKDRLKILQHELGCRTALLKARKPKHEGRATATPLADADAEPIKSQEKLESSKEDIDDEKPHETTSNLQQDGVNPSESEQVEYKEKTENKRLLPRRQSARFKVAEVKHAEDLFDTNKTIVSASQLPEDFVGEQGSTSDSAVVKSKGSTDSSGQQFEKSSLFRPGCRTGLLKAKKPNLEGRETTTPLADADAEMLIKSQEEIESSKEDIDDEKPHETAKNGISPSKQVEYKEKAENKRPLPRRQSARFKVAEVKHAEDFFDTNKTIVSASQLPEDFVGELGSTSDSAVVKSKGSTDSSGQQFEKSSLFRPGCRTGLLKAKKPNLEGRETTTPLADADAEMLIKSQEEIESSKEDIDDEKPHETAKNGISPSKQVEYKEKAENKRLLPRRQSARFKVAEVKHAEDFFDTNKTIVSASQLPEDFVGEQGSTSDSAVVKSKGSTDSSGQQFEKSSLFRPGCRTGLLKAKKPNLEGRETTTPLADADAEMLIKSQEEIESSKEDIDDEKPHETAKNGISPSKQVEYKEKAENKRLLPRRQSARFKVAEVKHAEDFFDTNKTIVSASQLPEDFVGEQGSTSDSAVVKSKGSTDSSGQQFEKSSLFRPGCRTGLLKAKKPNLEGRETTTPLADADAEMLIKSQEEIESSKEDIDDEKPHETAKNGISPSKQIEYKEKAENKRLLLRRQSARFKVAEVKHAEDLFDTNKTIVFASQLPEDSVGEQGSTSESAVVKNKGSTDGSGQQFGKPSLLRPSRATAKKVQSYKERPINVKLRRTE